MMVPILMDRMKIDDPVGAFAVHGVGGAWVRSERWLGGC